MNVTDEVCRARCDAARYAGEVQGRADERADVVAWLRSIPWRPTRTPEELSAAIERGEHVDARKGGDVKKKPRQVSRRERALSCAAREVLRAQEAAMKGGG